MRWLVVPSVLGVIVFACQVHAGRIDHPLCTAYGVFMSVWPMMLIIFWRRRCAVLGYKWGVLQHDRVHGVYRHEQSRVQFHGTRRLDDVTREWVLWYPSWKRRLTHALITAPIVLVGVVSIVLTTIFLFRARDAYLRGMLARGHSLHPGRFDGRAFAGEHMRDMRWWLFMLSYPCVHGLLIPLLYALFKAIASWLTDLENHRTEPQYIHHLTLKVFSFKFFTVFTSLYYYAFLDKGSDSEFGMLRVAMSLGSLMTVGQLSQMLLRIWVPQVLHHWRSYWRHVRIKREESEVAMQANRRSMRAEPLDKRPLRKQVYLEQAKSDVWDELELKKHDGFDDYAWMAINFGYVSLFSMVLPSTAVVALVISCCQLRMDAYKLCCTRQRPIATKTGGIGVWEHVLLGISFLAMLTNCALFGFTSGQVERRFPELLPTQRVLLVVLVEHVLLGLGWFLLTAISPIPNSVLRAIARDRSSAAARLPSSQDRQRQQAAPPESAPAFKEELHPHEAKSDEAEGALRILQAHEVANRENVVRSPLATKLDRFAVL